MKVTDVFNRVNAIERLASAYEKFVAPRPGVQGPQSYEVSGLLKAANDIAAQIPALAEQTDDSPL
jgi:hypothetical protein